MHKRSTVIFLFITINIALNAQSTFHDRHFLQPDTILNINRVTLLDIATNTIGYVLFLSQQLAWEEQRVQFKFSFHQTKFSKYRPSVLGQNLQENLFKDYNGQTYWLSTNIYSFLSSSSGFPKWFNIA